MNQLEFSFGDDDLSDKDEMTKKEKDHQYYEKNKERIKASQRQYRRDNPEKRREVDRLYRENNKEKEVVRHRIYRENNKEQIKESSRQYREDNAEKEVERHREYRENNKEKLAESDRQYRKDNPEIRRSIGQRRRAKKRGLASTLTQEEWQKILDDHFGCCHYCGKKSDKLHQEHKIPVVKGGGYTKENIVPACQKCNYSKHTKDYNKFVKLNSQRLQLKLF